MDVLNILFARFFLTLTASFGIYLHLQFPRCLFTIFLPEGVVTVISLTVSSVEGLLYPCNSKRLSADFSSLRGGSFETDWAILMCLLMGVFSMDWSGLRVLESCRLPTDNAIMQALFCLDRNRLNL